VEFFPIMKARIDNNLDPCVSSGEELCVCVCVCVCVYVCVKYKCKVNSISLAHTVREANITRIILSPLS
jgi:hypothetical protein